MFCTLVVQHKHADHVRNGIISLSKPVQKVSESLTILCYTFQVFSIESIISTVVQLPHQQEAFHLIYMVIEYKYPVVCHRLYLTESSSDCFRPLWVVG